MSSKDKKYNMPDDSELDFYDPERDGPADDEGFDEDEPEESHEGVREENTVDAAEADEEDSNAEADGDIPEDVEADREPEEDSLQDDGEYEPEGYDENDSEEYDEGYDEEEDSVPVRYSSKSARPELKVYVPAAEPDEEPVIPVRRKKHKGLKICGLLLAMFVVVAGCAYAGISYYYSDRFFQGTWINGIDCSGKTAYETETCPFGEGPGLFHPGICKESGTAGYYRRPDQLSVSVHRRNAGSSEEPETI